MDLIKEFTQFLNNTELYMALIVVAVFIMTICVWAITDKYLDRHKKCYCSKCLAKRNTKNKD